MSTKESFTGSFTPRDGQTLKVVRVARISAKSQGSEELQGQLTAVENYIKSRYDGEVEFVDIATQGSEANQGREKSQELLRIIESQSADVIVAEDQTRFGRCRRQFYQLLKSCLRVGVRFIGINDGFDTAFAYDREPSNATSAKTAEAK